MIDKLPYICFCCPLVNSRLLSCSAGMLNFFYFGSVWIKLRNSLQNSVRSSAFEWKHMRGVFSFNVNLFFFTWISVRYLAHLRFHLIRLSFCLYYINCGSFFPCFLLENWARILVRDLKRFIYELSLCLISCSWFHIYMANM